MAGRDVRLTPLRDALIGQALPGEGGVAYHLEECIGEGGQGWVFRAHWDDPTGVPVIVKVLRPDVVTVETLQRFKREAEVLRMLSTERRPNPYIVRFYDHAVAKVKSPTTGEYLGLPFTVLEYVHGTTLERELKEQRGRGMSATRVRRLLRQIAHGLDLVHKQKVVHRDLKPSNILLTTEGGAEVAKVTDFGLVKVVSLDMQRTTTLAGASLGYAPKEQYEQGNKRVSPRTDVFALGAVVFEMLAGAPAFPFEGHENPLLVVTRILNAPRPSLLAHKAQLAPELLENTEGLEALDAALKKALASEPDQRFESVLDLLAAVEPALKTAVAQSGGAARIAFEATIRAESQPDQRPGSSPNASIGSGPTIAAEIAPISSTPQLPKAAAPTSGVSSGARSGAIPPTPSAIARQFTFRIVSPPIAADIVKAADFLPAQKAFVAIGPRGIGFWKAGVWSDLSCSLRVDARALRGVRSLGRGLEVALFGDGAQVFRRGEHGALEAWVVPDREIVFRGGFVDDQGTSTLVGERPQRGSAGSPQTSGVLCQFQNDRLVVLAESRQTARLHAATRMRSGTVVACGDHGALCRLEMGVLEHVTRLCQGNLFAIAALADGSAAAVGAGGHALHVSSTLQGLIQPVRTVRSLLAIAPSNDGSVWAGAQEARILRRTDSTWERADGGLALASDVVALHADASSMFAVFSDGAVVEGNAVS